MSGTKLHSFKCPDCAAPLHVEPGTRELVCTYCGHLIEVTHAAPPIEAPPRVPFSEPRPDVVPSDDTPAKPAGPVALLVIACAVGGLAFGIFSIATSEHMQWVHHAEGPFIVNVNQDAIEDIVGQHRLFEKASDGSSTNDYVGAFDGATHKLIWRAGPFGKSGALHFGVSGRRVLATDDRHNARLFDLTSGKPTGTVVLSDVARRVCPAAAGFYVESIDGKGVFVDLEAHASEQTAPPECRLDDRCEPVVGHFRQRSGCPQPVPDSADFMASLAVGDDATLVIAGRHRPGTQTPTLKALERPSLATRWSRPIASVDPTTVRNEEPKLLEVRDGVVYTQYGLEAKGARLVAIDVVTGKNLWEVLVPHSKEGGSAADSMVVSATRIYLPHWTWLDVFDRKTGEALGTIGRW